jgi:hypothetical protein
MRHHRQRKPALLINTFGCIIQGASILEMVRTQFFSACADVVPLAEVDVECCLVRVNVASEGGNAVVDRKVF